VAALTIYLDDSGTHPTSKIALAAAWVAPVKMWERFTADWRGAQNKYGFKTFHASECAWNNPKSEFADESIWNEDKKRMVFARLTQIMTMRIMCGFGMSVGVQDYLEVIPERAREKTGKYHYTWVLRAVLGMIEQWRTARGFTQPTEYIFDRMAKGEAKKEIESCFAESQNPTDNLHKYGIYKGCHSFRDKADILPLQASDTAAWLFNQRAHMELTGKSPHPLAIDPWNTHTGQIFQRWNFPSPSSC
jgi:hypothetical protein